MGRRTADGHRRIVVNRPAERPRDRLGRPLRPGDPAAVPGVPAWDRLTSGEALAASGAYLADGLPFHAHEILEQRWRCAPAEERPAWRALAQWAAGLTHAARGNVRGARAMLLRAVDGLEPYSAAPVGLVSTDGRVLDVAAVCEQARQLASDPTSLAEWSVKGITGWPFHR